MIHIAFKILVFYKTDDALEQYINRFRFVSQESLVTSSKNERLYLFDGVQVTCIRGLNENMRGRWADFVARFPFRFLMEFLKIEVNCGAPGLVGVVVGGIT